MITMTIETKMTGSELMERLGNPAIGEYVVFTDWRKYSSSRWLTWKTSGRGKHAGKVFVHLKPLHDSWAFCNWLEGVGYVGEESKQIFSSQDDNGYNLDYSRNRETRRDMLPILDGQMGEWADAIENAAYSVLAKYEEQ